MDERSRGLEWSSEDPQPPPPPPPVRGTAGHRRSWGWRLGILTATGLVAAGTAAATVVLLREPPPPPADPVTVASEEPEPQPAPEPEPEELTAAELADRYGPAVWKVESSGCGVDATGSAFAIDDRTLITNWHVVVTDPTPTLVHRDGTTRRQGTVIGWSDQPDVAVITVDEPVDDWMEFTSATELSEGQTLVGLGYPAPATDFTVTPSSILSFQADGNERQAIRADGLLDKGNSGGPVLTTSGHVAGVVTELALNTTGVQVVPLAYTYDYLQDTIDRIVAEPDRPEADCAAAGLPAELPDDWDSDSYPVDGPDTYGDDPDLDRLWDLCADGDWDACDELYWDTPVGSGYEAFGASCGDREWWWGACATFMDDGTGTWDGGDETWVEPDSYGDDADLDRLWDLCADGDMTACDELYWNSGFDTRYEDYGSTCGDRQAPTAGDCDVEASSLPEYGTNADPDPSLAGLRSACGAGDWHACDELYWDSPLDSDDETYGATCGNRDSWEAGGCVDRHG
jgi:S1-C subfamily serine protease